MSHRFAAFGWSFELAPGWTAEIRQDFSFGEASAFLIIAPETKDAEFRLTPDDRDVMPASVWVERVGHIHRDKGRTVSAIRCGDFVGHLMQFESDNEWIRGWALHSGPIPLDANYRCQSNAIARDDSIVDWMLGTLRVD